LGLRGVMHLTANNGDSNGSRRGRQGGRRPREQAVRRYRVQFSLTEQEYAQLSQAAARAGMARGCYAAQVVLAHATGTPSAGPESGLREALRELMCCAGLVRKIGALMNQAVARLHATGQKPGDLEPCALECARRVRRLDAAAEQVREAIRSS
jgi:hypothetical protein